MTEKNFPNFFLFLSLPPPATLPPPVRYLCAVLASFFYVLFPILPFIYVCFNFFLLLNHIPSSLNMVHRLSQYISMHLAWLKEGHLRGRMDDMSTTKFRLFTLLSDYFLRLCSLVYCTSVLHSYLPLLYQASTENKRQMLHFFCCPPK